MKRTKLYGWRKARNVFIHAALSLSVALTAFAGTGYAESSAFPSSAPIAAAELQSQTASATALTIAQARQQGTGSVTVKGEIVAVYPKSNAYIHDGTAGLRIFGNEASTLTLGSEIEITGTLTDYNGDLELKYPFTVQPLSGNQFTPPPPLELPVNQVGEASEGQLVKVKNVWITGDYSSGDGGVTVTDGSGTLVIYALDQPALKTYLLGLPKDPNSKFDIVGASSAFRSTRQLFPRSQADIVPAGSGGGDWHEATVASITDGDTIRFSPSLNVEGRSANIVRMLNIDAPEVAQAPYGDQATAVLRSIISDGTAVKLQLDATKVDGYGRLLAHIFRKSDNLDVNKEMLRQGAAVNYYIYPNMLYFEEYGAAAKQASQEGKGIWNPSNPLAKLPYEYRAAGCPERYVGDYRTKKYYIPKRYSEIPFESRVFFGSNKQEARDAGYSPVDPADPSHNPATDCSTGQLKTIAELRAGWNTNDTFQVIGEVTAVHAPDHAFVQDATGGIHLYGKIPETLTVGKEIKVNGNVQEFYGDLEFRNARIEVLPQDAIPAPQPALLKLNQLNESNEGSLVQVKNVWITGDYNGGNGGVRLTDETGANVVLFSPYPAGSFLTELRSLPRGRENPFDIVGNVSGWNDLREIYPRSLADIVPSQGGEQRTPTPASGKMAFNSENAASAVVSGQSGAATPASAVRFYSNASKQTLIGSVTADGNGAFTFSFDNSASRYAAVFVTATAAGKAESGMAQVTAGGLSGLTIAQARQQGTGSVTVRGKIAAVYPKSNAYLYDGTAGLRIYGNEAASLTLGSDIEITGTLTDYNGDLELKYPFTIKPLSGTSFPTPQPIELSVHQVGEANEGQLVKVKNVWITGEYGSGDGGVTVTDGTGTLVVYALDQPALKTYLQSLERSENKKFDIVGASSAFRDTIQIFPRGQADIAPAGGQPSEKGSIQGTVKAEGRGAQGAIEIVAKHQVTGQETKVSPAADGAFALTGLPAGSYTLSARLKHYFTVQANVAVQEGQQTNAGNLAAGANGGTADGMMRAGNTYAADNEVNLYDAVIVGANIGKATAEALAAADINGDGAVTRADLELVERNFLWKQGGN